MRLLTAELLATLVAFGAGCTESETKYSQPQYAQPQPSYEAAPPPAQAPAPEAQMPQGQAQPPSQPYAQPYAQPGQRPPMARSHLGAAIQPMTGEERTYFGAPPDRGVLVTRVMPGSAAEQAGLRVGDILVFAGGKLIENPDDVRTALGERTEPMMRLEVIRRGQWMQLEANLGPPRREQVPGGQVM